MILPNLICPGAAKCGTTSLYEILIHHPDIFLSPVNKEAHFFDYDDNYARGTGWYSKTFFSGHRGQKITGDFTPSYMFVPSAVERIRRDLGNDTRFLFMLRDPVLRAFSHYQFNVRRSYEKRTFEDALETENESTGRDFFSLLHYSYAGRGLYAAQINRFTSQFSPEQIMVVLFEEDFVKNKAETVRKIEDFLGISHARLNLEVHSNAAKVARSSVVSSLVFGNKAVRRIGKAIIPSYRSRRSIFRNLKRLIEKPAPEAIQLEDGLKSGLFVKYFREDVERLEAITGRPLDCWKN